MATDGGIIFDRPIPATVSGTRARTTDPLWQLSDSTMIRTSSRKADISLNTSSSMSSLSYRHQVSSFGSGSSPLLSWI